MENVSSLWYAEVSSRRYKKRDYKDNFALREAEKFNFEYKELRIEKLKTWIEMRQPIRFGGAPIRNIQNTVLINILFIVTTLSRKND